MKRFQKTLVVSAADLDDLNHVNNVRYLEWVQEISREHWEALSNQEWDARYLWVVRSHHITYHRPALLGEELLLTTYVPAAEGAISRRKVEMERSGDGVRIAECLTEWVLLEAATGRPVRMPGEMKIVFE